MANYNSGQIKPYSGNAEAGVPYHVKDTVERVDWTPLVNQYLKESKEKAFERDGVRSVQAEVDYQTAFIKKKSEMDPSSPTYLEDLQAWGNENRPTYLEQAGFETREAKSALDKRLIQFNGQTVIQGVGEQQKVTAEKAITTRRDMENTVLNGIRNDPDQMPALVKDFSGMADRLNAGIPAVAREKMSREFADNAVLAATEGMALKGNVGGAREFLKSSVGIDPDTIRAMSRRLNEIENNNEQEFNKVLTTQYADVYDQVNSGQVTSLSQLDDPRYNQLWEARPMARVQLRETLRNKQEAQVREARVARDHSRKVALGEGGGYTSGQSDKLWAAQMMDDPPKDGADVATRLVAHVRTVGMLPKQIKQSFDLAEYSNDPEQLATYGMLEDLLHEEFPSLPTGAGKIYSEMRTKRELYGVTYDQAAEMALKDRKTNPDIKERRKVEFTATAKESKYAPRTSLGTKLGLPADQLPPEMVQQYDEIVRDTYNQSGDIAYSAKSAADVVRRRYVPGTTKIGGVDRVVSYPPEAVIAQNIPNAKSYHGDLGPAITEHLVTALKGKVNPYSPEIGKEWEVIDGQPPVRLQDTPQTARQIAAGEAPTYEVQQRIPGGYATVRDNKGEAITYTAPNWDELKNYPVIKNRLDADTQKMKQSQAKAKSEEETTKALAEPEQFPGTIKNNPVMNKGGTAKDVRNKLREYWGIK